jgi:hypothetical protein
MNTAKRILQIVDLLCNEQLRDGVKMSAVWTRVLGVDSETGSENDELFVGLQALRAEVDAAAAQLAVRGLPSELYVPLFSRIKDTASPASVRHDWKGMAPNVMAPEVRLAVAWAAAVLPDDEADLGIEQVGELSRELDDLLGRVESAELSPYVLAYVTKQLRLLQTALRWYKVRGVKGVHEGLEQVAGAAIKARADLAKEGASATPAARGFVSRANEVVKKVIETCDAAEKLRKGGAALMDMAEYTRIVWDVVDSAG